MGYYDALFAKWQTAPEGTNEEKLAWINTETVDGPAVPMVVPTNQIFNLLDRTEFEALAPELQQSVKDLLNMTTIDASPGTPMRARWVEIFPAGTVSNANLMEYAAMFDTPQVPWATAPLPEGGGLNGMVSMNDLEPAGIINARINPV